MRFVAVILTLSWAVVACEPDLGSCDMAAATKLTYVNGTPYYEGQALLNASCAGGSCHSSGAIGDGRNGAPHGLNFDVQPVTQNSTAADITTLKAGLTEVRDEATDLWGQIDDGDMPPGKIGERPAPTAYSDAAGTMPAALNLASSKDKIRNWLACQAPVVAGTSDSVVKADAMAVGAIVDPGKSAIGGGGFQSIYDNLLKGTCVTCHSTKGAYASLVLDFSTADTAYATLVGKATFSGADGACMGKTLVKANDCANSVLWQKLKYPTGSPMLCGASMPFGAAMVSADVAQAVCDWINAGAMK